MKTENKVRAYIISPKGERQIKECDLVVAFGFSEDDDGMEIQTVRFGGDIDAVKNGSSVGALCFTSGWLFHEGSYTRNPPPEIDLRHNS